MRACWLKWVGRDWSISADYIWLNYSDANSLGFYDRIKHLIGELADKHQLSIVPSLRWGSANMSGAASAKIYIAVLILLKNLPCGYFRF